MASTERYTHEDRLGRLCRPLESEPRTPGRIVVEYAEYLSGGRWIGPHVSETAPELIHPREMGHYTKAEVLAAIERALDSHRATASEREAVHAAVERDGWLTITGPAVYVHRRLYTMRGRLAGEAV